MVSHSMGFHSWKTPTNNSRKGAPTEEGEGTEYKKHVLYGKWGIFNEQLLWECEGCGKERTLRVYYRKPCPAAEE